MSLEYAILGFLSYHPLSGYDLKKVFDGSVRHFWPADQSQIYRTLVRLSEEGYVERETIRGTDRPDRKEYRITPAGREALRAWLLSEPPVHDTRIAELVQVFFAGQLSDGEVRALFEQLAASARASLEAYDRIPRPAGAEIQAASMQRERFFWHLTLEYGILSARRDIEWLEGVLARIQSGELPPPNL